MIHCVVLAISICDAYFDYSNVGFGNQAGSGRRSTLGFKFEAGSLLEARAHELPA